MENNLSLSLYSSCSYRIVKHQIVHNFFKPISIHVSYVPEAELLILLLMKEEDRRVFYLAKGTFLWQKNTGVYLQRVIAK